MKLVKKLKTRISKKGHLQSWALFWCDFCNQEVEKELGQGKRDKSCGCQKIKFNNQNGENNLSFKHGESNTRLYAIWHGIKQRILYLKSNNYKNYGGSGITICNEWLEFIPFRDWSLANGYADNLEIDRIENNLGYNPKNCRWVTITEQNRNRGCVVLSLEKAQEIRELYKTGNYTYKYLSLIFNIDFGHIGQIIRNEIWRYE